MSEPHSDTDNNQPTRPQRPIINIDPANVPPELQPLIPYAEKWGIEDSELLNALLDEASPEELKELDKVVSPALKVIDRALWNTPLFGTPDAFFFQFLVRAKRRAWLKMTGWPDNYPNPRINPERVPTELHPLIPYAEKWGFPDTELQSKLLHEAPVQEILEMYEILYPLWEDVWRYTQSDAALADPARYEMRMFDNFRNSLSEAGRILDDTMPERWLKIIGWPQRFAPFPFDPAKVPTNLRPLAPYIEKWVREDDIVRVSALRIATTAELEEFVAAVDQLGRKTIFTLADELYETEIAKEEGAALLILLEMVDHAVTELKNRGRPTASYDFFVR